MGIFDALQNLGFVPLNVDEIVVGGGGGGGGEWQSASPWYKVCVPNSLV